MKKTRRWLALLLAVILVGSNALYQIGTSMSASETDTTAESGQQDDSAAVPETQDQDTASLDQQNNTGGVQVQEVTPQTQQKETTSQSEAAKTQQVQPAQNNASASDQNTQAAPSAEPAQETPEEKTYHVTIQKSDVDGGTIKAWGSDGNKTDVTYNSENKYVKEVKEGEDFNFEITAKDTYKVAKVTDQNGTTVEPKAVNNNVYTYEVKNITAERTYSITYAKEEVKKAESTSNGDQQKSDDEQSEDADDDGEPAAKAQENVNVVSGSDDKEKVESVAETHEDTDTEKWITVGKSVTLTSKDYQYGNYSHEWSIEDDSKKIVSKSGSGSSITVTGLKEGTATVKDKITWWSVFDGKKKKTITYTIHVSKAVAPTAITISGADKVTQFETAQLTYKLTPSNAVGEVQWSSSNEQILTVDSNGLVSGLRQGTATVTASVQDKESNSSVTAEKTIQVVANEKATDSAIVYYLKDPTKDANSNDTGNWGPQYGIATVNTTGATWTNDKNCFDNVDQRVVSWPNGTNVVTKDSDAWNQIFEKYQSSIQSQLGVEITKDDVEAITLVPAKISRNNQGTNPDKHLDCNVNIKCKNVATVKYYLYDAGAVKFDMLGSKNYVINGTSETQPSDVTSKTFPATKTVNGVTYTFSGWYTNQDLTNAAPAFPAKVETSITYYAKYIAGYHVIYNLAGGKFSDGSTNATEKHNEGTNVVVKEEPTRKGYKFTGWTVEGLDNTTISSGESFTMPGNTVRLTANWEEQKIKDFISLTPTDAERVYNGETLAAGTATVLAKKAEANLDGVKIEYQKADKTWTDNPAEITATNVADSTTVKVRVTSEKYTGKLEGTEKLTITKRPITITGDGWTGDQPYTGSEYKKTAYTVKEANAENTRGLVAGQTVNTSYEITGTNAGTYTGTFGENFEIKTAGGVLGIGAKDVTANYAVTKTPGTLTITKAEIAKYVTLTTADVTEVYDGKAYAAGTATAADTNGNTLKIEYQKADGSWTENPTEITATNVSDSKTVNVRVSSEGNYEGYVTGTEKLTITPKAVTVTADDLSKIYKEVDPELTATVTGTLGNDKVDYKLSREKGEDVGDYAITPAGEEEQGNYKVTYKPGTLTIVAAQRATALSVTSYNGVYDAENHTITVNGTVDGDKVEYSYDGGKTWVTDLKEYKNVTKGSVAIQVKITNKNYTPAETILSGSVTITPAALTITTPKAEKVYDGNALTADGTISGFVNGETATFVTTGSQTEVGNSKNTYTLTWDGTAKEANYTVSDSVGTLKVTKQSIVPDPDNPESYKDVTIDDPSDATYDGKEHKWTPVVTDKDGNELKEGTDYEVSYSKDDFTNVTGEIKVTITGKGNYTGTVDKTYQITPKAVIITTDSDTRAFNDQPLTAPGRVDGIVAGETYEFTVTGTQTYVGSSANSYQMTWAKKGENKYTAKKSNYKVEENIGTLTVTDGTPENPVTPSLVVNKTHDTDKTYKAGDVITFTITVKNIYDEAKTITLEEQEGVTLDKTTFENVKPGKEITATATYTVTEADIVNGTFTNNVKATFSGVDKEYTGTDTVDKFEESRPHMTITKVTKDAGKDHIYKLGETINYVITVKNDGNLTLTNVKIEDALTGNAGENAWTIDTFAPGETQTFEASYVVTEADVIAGKVVNNATGEAENPDPKKEETPVTPGEKEDPVETPNPGLTVIKTSDKTGEVKLGDKITYTITVTNNGNVTISEVKLEDSLTGDDWTLGNIKPGETVTKKTTYTVTEKDIIAGKVENHATATGKEPGGKDITGEGEKTVTTEESNPQITVTKETTSTPKNGKTYALGEKITYKITAKNTGNLTLTDVTVSDELTGNTGDKAFKIDGNFKPGEEATFETSYTVKESDLGKTVVNEATAAGKTTDPKNPEPGVTPGTTEDPVDQKNPAMTITKKVTDKKEEYQIGDTVEYEITVKNTGNTTQNNVLVEDRMNAAGSAVITKVEGAKGTIDGANVTLDTLAPGKEATITAEYTVVKEDRGNTITNAAVAKGEGETPVTPEVPVDVEDVYDIHVTHVFADGEESSAALPEDYDIENLKPGTTKLLNAEEVSGYTAYPAAERVTIEEEDVTVTFVYYKDAIGTDPANPDQPDNIPDRYQAVVKFEAVNGTVNIDHAVVTLFDENNEPAENGVGHLSLMQIANATADAGYDQSSLSWTPANPTIRYEITGEMTFTASFTATPAIPGTTPANPTNPTPATPSTPANPAPATPSAPANQTPARSTNIITRAAEAIADGAERIASDVREVLNNDDEDVPLAKQKLDDHKCCILHFLIMLLAAILYGFYTHNMKKRQKKMFEAREELDLELARRGLPTTKEQEQM